MPRGALGCSVARMESSAGFEDAELCRYVMEEEYKNPPQQSSWPLRCINAERGEGRLLPSELGARVRTRSSTLGRRPCRLIEYRRDIPGAVQTHKRETRPLLRPHSEGPAPPSQVVTVNPAGPR